MISHKTKKKVKKESYTGYSFFLELPIKLENTLINNLKQFKQIKLEQFCNFSNYSSIFYSNGNINKDFGKYVMFLVVYQISKHTLTGSEQRQYMNISVTDLQENFCTVIIKDDSKNLDIQIGDLCAVFSTNESHMESDSDSAVVDLAVPAASIPQSSDEFQNFLKRRLIVTENDKFVKIARLANFKFCQFIMLSGKNCNMPLQSTSNKTLCKTHLRKMANLENLKEVNLNLQAEGITRKILPGGRALVSISQSTENLQFHVDSDSKKIKFSAVPPKPKQKETPYMSQELISRLLYKRRKIYTESHMGEIEDPTAQPIESSLSSSQESFINEISHLTSLYKVYLNTPSEPQEAKIRGLLKSLCLPTNKDPIFLLHIKSLYKYLLQTPHNSRLTSFIFAYKHKIKKYLKDFE